MSWSLWPSVYFLIRLALFFSSIPPYPSVHHHILLTSVNYPIISLCGKRTCQPLWSVNKLLCVMTVLVWKYSYRFLNVQICEGAVHIPLICFSINFMHMMLILLTRVGLAYNSLIFYSVYTNSTKFSRTRNFAVSEYFTTASNMIVWNPMIVQQILEI